MRKLALLVAALSVAYGTARADDLKIGFLTTVNFGPGQEQLKGFKLGLGSLGWAKDGDKLAGRPTRVEWCDDRRRPDIGVDCVKKMLQQGTQVVAGVLWSNILMAVQRYVRRSDAILVATNAGTSPLAGKLCSKRFIWASWQNDAWAETTGKMAADEGMKRVVLIAPNYQGGKDQFKGFKRFYTGGKVVDEILFKLGQTDFQADFTRITAKKPDAVFAFAPGGMGIAFMRQWKAAGLDKKMKLYTVFMVDNTTLKAMGEAAAGSVHVNYWSADLDNPANRKFVKDYVAAYGAPPSNYAAQAYDAALLIGLGAKAIGAAGKVDTLKMMAAMRTADYPSVRGKYAYNVNGMPIQTYYRREVVPGTAGSLTIKTTGPVIAGYKDPYWQACPAGER